jgi:cytochrome c oxidase assembly protein subunit 11
MHKATRQTVIKLAVIAVAMFVAVFTIMPPLYTLLCEVTGLRSTAGKYQAEEIKVDRSREITVRFVGTHNDSMPWDFFPMEYKVTVNPGEKKTIRYFARNKTTLPMVAQAVPSISPFNAVNYFHKIECFCFNRQPLAGGESAELGLQFVVDQDLPAKVTTITLSYTLFDITEQTPTPTLAPTPLAAAQQP